MRAQLLVVLGGAGAIGRAFINALQECQLEAVVVERSKTVVGVTALKADLLDAAQTLRATAYATLAQVLGAVDHALALAGSLTWEILWALILGFALSAVVQAVVRKSTIVGLLGDDRPRTLAIAASILALGMR